MMPSFEWNLLTQQHKICSQEATDYVAMISARNLHLTCMGLIRYRVVTDGRTDRITIANMR